MLQMDLDRLTRYAGRASTHLSDMARSPIALPAVRPSAHDLARQVQGSCYALPTRLERHPVVVANDTQASEIHQGGGSGACSALGELSDAAAIVGDSPLCWHEGKAPTSKVSLPVYARSYWRLASPHIPVE